MTMASQRPGASDLSDIGEEEGGLLCQGGRGAGQQAQEQKIPCQRGPGEADQET